MNVLSLFDGMSCGQIALERAGIKVDNYFAAEIDKYAIKVTQANYPETTQLGDVLEVKAEDLPNIDLLIGGSPCQGFSFAGKQLNFDDPRSKLFFEFVRLLKECKPKYFLLENVKMKKEYQDIISEYLCVEPIMINSALVSAQNRKRLYWTNIPGVEQPEDNGILLKDILEDGEPLRDKSQTILSTIYKENAKSMVKRKKKGLLVLLDKHTSKNGLKCVAGLNKNKKWLDDGKLLQRNFSQGERVYSIEGKSPTLSSSSGGTAGIGNALITDIDVSWYRKLSIIECECLQTVPDNYTNHVSNTQRYKMLGNGWTVDVIAHIFKSIPR